MRGRDGNAAGCNPAMTRFDSGAHIQIEESGCSSKAERWSATSETRVRVPPSAPNRGLSSEEEHLVSTQGVVGSNPTVRPN